jgi:amidophosphoribosyltransferase
MKRVVAALNPRIAGFEASCFDGHYITGDVSAADFAALELQRKAAVRRRPEEARDASSRLALQGSES